MNNQLFIGTKRFGSREGWLYVVTIKDDSIMLKLYPDAMNEFHKDKDRPKEIIKGKIKDGEIITEEKRFKFENGILYELNNEDTWNDYPEIRENKALFN